MHDDRATVEARFERHLQEFIKPAVRGPSVPLAIEVWRVPDDRRPGRPPSVDEARAAEYTAIAPGEPWGAAWGTAWFRISGTVPEEWAGCRVEALIDLGFGWAPGFQAEGLIWADGGPVQGIHPMRRWVPVASPAAGGEAVRFLVEGAANPDLTRHEPSVLSDVLTSPETPIYRLGAVELSVIHEHTRDLVWDLDVLWGLMKELPEGDGRRHRILRAVERALDVLDLGDVRATAEAARAELAGVAASPAVPSAHHISAVGHAHIDTAWLWPLRETVRKCARTFASADRLMDDYPEYQFACSQALQYEWIRTGYPELFERIKGRVDEGRWHPVGGMWVEADGNLPGGEALARQFVHGQKFFAEHFGVESSECWIPDVFGYPATLPQIMSLAGIRRFVTQKLSWNRTNRFPHHTFRWEGLDGTRVTTHFPPVDTYNATFAPSELRWAEGSFKDHGRSNSSLMPFGHGNGGGGPTREMLERFARERNLEGLPRVDIESPGRFFDRVEVEYADPPVWVGELYFEMHRGTFTSQAATKAGNRRSEHLLRAAELWSAAAALLAGAPYPAARLEAIWKDVLTLQFHDILPGSSIGWVHREAEATYERVAEELDAICRQALAHLSAEGCVANPAPHPRHEVVVGHKGVLDLGADPDLVQEVGPGRVARWMELPAHGWVSLAPGPQPASEPAGPPSRQVVVEGGPEGGVLENGLLRVSWDRDGLLTSVVDLRRDRELVAVGQRANLCQLFADHPTTYDAWELEDYTLRHPLDLTEAELVEVAARGPLVGSLRVRRRFGASTLTQEIVLRAGSARLDICTEVDWQETHRLLKVAFPLDVHANRAAFEVAFGHVHRPTHRNTSWDAARFEVAGHRWADVSEPGFGVAVCNDSKYGFDAVRSEGPAGSWTCLRLSLLRATTYPDPVADRGRVHRFTYSVLPHGGDLGQGEVIAEAYRLNLPVQVAEAAQVDLAEGSGIARSAVPEGVAFVEVDHPGLVVEAVKLADDGGGDLIVRLYEGLGGRARGRMRCGVPIDAVEICDLLERPWDPADAAAGPMVAPTVAIDGGTVVVELRPFQIATLRLRPGGPNARGAEYDAAL